MCCLTWDVVPAQASTTSWCASSGSPCWQSQAVEPAERLCLSLDARWARAGRPGIHQVAEAAETYARAQGFFEQNILETLEYVEAAAENSTTIPIYIIEGIASNITWAPKQPCMMIYMHTGCMHACRMRCGPRKGPVVPCCCGGVALGCC